MRYIKVLLLAIFIFCALVFFYQNQAPLSQELQLTFNLFFLPAYTSIPLPFYFIVVAAFFVGCLLTLFLLLWDKFALSARLMKTRWRVSALERDVARLNKKLEEEHEAAAQDATVAKIQDSTPAH